ncbi:nucleoporin NUP56 [Cladorrhinum sp. PSN332]|nr:nucleoporin NUP56 [Cladorrhinum sp. PSN332]
MAEDPISDHVEAGATKEDAETTAARRELKQTSISEKAGHNSLSRDSDKSASEDDVSRTIKTPKSPSRRISPPVSFTMSSSNNSNEDALKDQISSPKKKRAHDEYDENKDVAEAPLDPAPSAATTVTITSVTLSRTDRSEPEKKRPRDRQASASAVRSGKEEVEPLSASASPRSSMEVTMTTTTTTTEAKDSAASSTQPKDQPQTSTSAFASSGFAKLASSSASPFGSFGGAGKPSLFGSATSGGGSFTSVLGSTSSAATPAAPKLSFGSGASSSPFASINGGSGGGSVFKSSPFGSAFGSSALSGSRLSTFGKPGEALKSDKPAKPFGAPDSDAEDDDGPNTGDEGGDEEKGEGAGSEEEKDAEKEKEEAKAADEEKKLKLRKINVDDGEGGEVTLYSQRAKMFVMEKGVGWKERGAGMLKVNVPEATVDVDDNGVPNASSFDASVLDDIEGHAKNVRLIMRQDHTLRVILNTVVLPAMKFQVTHKLKSATILFTAFDGNDHIQVQMKMSQVNANSFFDLMETLKKALADV